jgi:lysophospholipase L1-like esterase
VRVRRRWLIAAVVTAALAAAGVTTGTTQAVAESNGGVRIMPLGDSITEGTQVPGGYRIGLWQRLAGGGYRVDYVGSQFNGPSNLGDHDHEGHPGWRIDQIDANIAGWLRTYTPRTVLLHIGTNDILQNSNVSGAPGRLSTLIDHITAAVPDADVFVATIIPLANAGQESAGRTFNAAIPGIVQSKVAAGRHVHLVDMHAALTTGDLTDGVHPTATGYDKMAATWYTALRAVPGSLGGTTSSPPSSSRPASSPPRSSPPVSSAPVSSAPVSSPAGGRSCAAGYAVAGQWSDGFQATVTVTAGGTAISGWTVQWQFGNGQTVGHRPQRRLQRCARRRRECAVRLPRHLERHQRRTDADLRRRMNAMADDDTDVATSQGGSCPWDVVNGAGEDRGWRVANLQRTGDGFPEEVFRSARAADPGTELCYNLDGVAVRSADVRTVGCDVKARGGPVDGIGFQPPRPAAVSRRNRARTDRGR